jgi:hypothetical protein
MVFYIDINQMYLIMVQHLSIQGNNNKNEFLHNRMLSLSSGGLSDDEFKFLQNYLMETAYSTKEVYNVSVKIRTEWDDFCFF